MTENLCKYNVCNTVSDIYNVCNTVTDMYNVCSTVTDIYTAHILGGFDSNIYRSDKIANYKMFLT